MAATQEVSPPWGTLPVEQYLIRNWDRYPNLSNTERRNQLVRDFLALDLIPQEWDGVRPPGPIPLDIRTPTAEEIDTILRPYRPLHMRAFAADIWSRSFYDFVNSPWVRTYYGPENRTQDESRSLDRAWTNLLQEAPDSYHFPIQPGAPPQGVSEPSLFAFDDPDQTQLNAAEQAWNRALLYLPEFASSESAENYSRQLESAGGDRRLDDEIAELRADAREEMEGGTVFPKVYPDEDMCEDIDSFTSTKSLQMAYTSRTVVVADKRALVGDGKVCMLCLDLRGNVVRWMHVTPEEIESELDTYSHEAMLQEAGWLEEVEGSVGVGAKYNPDGGELAAVVYGFGAGAGGEEGEGEGDDEE